MSARIISTAIDESAQLRISSPRRRDGSTAADPARGLPPVANLLVGEQAAVGLDLGHQVRLRRPREHSREDPPRMGTSGGPHLLVLHRLAERTRGGGVVEQIRGFRGKPTAYFAGCTAFPSTTPSCPSRCRFADRE